MKITFLGTGTSQGVPVIACGCEVCISLDIKDKRLRSSIIVSSKTTNVVIDTGPDFRQQMLNNKVQKLDAILYTHEHKDHVAGMDDVRAFNFKQKKPMDIYANERVQKALIREYPYVFEKNSYPGIPKVEVHSIEAESIVSVGDLNFKAIEVLHYKLPVLGFRIEDFVYITDANYISEDQKAKIYGAKILVINALRKEKHISHFTLQEAIELAEELKVEQVYLTHISHLMGKHEEVSLELPKHVSIAYDGLVLDI